MTLNERLNHQLEEKESEIESLQSELEDIKRRQELDQSLWQRHQYFKNDEFNKQMPFPRLEMRFKKCADWYHISWTYGIVFKCFSDLSNDTLRFIPINMTTSNGGAGTFEGWLNKDGSISTPFRDGVHIAVDSFTLGLPAFLTYEEGGIIQPIKAKELDKKTETSLTTRLSRAK